MIQRDGIFLRSGHAPRRVHSTSAEGTNRLECLSSMSALRSQARGSFDSQADLGPGTSVTREIGRFHPTLTPTTAASTSSHGECTPLVKSSCRIPKRVLLFGPRIRSDLRRKTGLGVPIASGRLSAKGQWEHGDTTLPARKSTLRRGRWESSGIVRRKLPREHGLLRQPPKSGSNEAGRRFLDTQIPARRQRHLGEPMPGSIDKLEGLLRERSHTLGGC